MTSAAPRRSESGVPVGSTSLIQVPAHLVLGCYYTGRSGDFCPHSRCAAGFNRGEPTVQTQGSLQESSLASLLQTMQTERATGALAIESADESASLYFLFGHLFHAAGPGGQGEDVVIHALGWQAGNFKFDPRAKLPPEETIKASPS